MVLPHAALRAVPGGSPTSRRSPALSWELGAPFLPFTQLMAVFPPASGHALPKAYRQLMVTPNSPIIDFYPIDFKNDLNGKRHQWQAISLLPFIDAARHRRAAPPLPTLTAEAVREA